MRRSRSRGPRPRPRPDVGIPVVVLIIFSIVSFPLSCWLVHRRTSSGRSLESITDHGRVGVVFDERRQKEDEEGERRFDRIDLID
jgi:hypothetical protein